MGKDLQTQSMVTAFEDAFSGFEDEEHPYLWSDNLIGAGGK
jgi:hypothetical protein